MTDYYKHENDIPPEPAKTYKVSSYFDDFLMGIITYGQIDDEFSTLAEAEAYINAGPTLDGKPMRYLKL